MSKSVETVWISLLLFAGGLMAQPAAGAASQSGAPSAHMRPPSERPIATAARVQDPPVIDGDVEGDPAYAGAPVIERFWQIRPNDGQPASERTVVRIVYTAGTIYFGVICYDREPGAIIVSDSRRDSSLDETDSFQIILDTYMDRQNGFVFGTSPAGVEYDGQVTKEGKSGESGMAGSRQQTGSGGGFNLNWDASWEVRTKISEIGWSAEFAIPLNTLRYPGGKTQTWGMNFQRNIRRHKEIAFWAPLDRQFNLYRLSEAGTLAALEVSGQRNLKFIPYVLGEIRRDGIEGSKVNWLGNVGGDVKYGLTPSLTLDLTYNTDFAQVEVDELQVNLDRFNLFYPEKRPFFLENAGLFSVGSPGQIEVFFSRRIGLADDGSAIPIIGGGRMSGKVGRFNAGFLNMQTEGIEGVAPSNNFTVGRISRELPNRSAIGAMVTNRQGTGDLAADRDYNRAFAVDGRWGIGQYGLVSGFAARTATPGISSDEYAFKLNMAYESPRWELVSEYAEVAANFNPEVGFLTRKDYRFTQQRILRRYRPGDFLGVLEFTPHVSYRGYWSFDGFQQSGFLHVDNAVEWKNGFRISTAMNFSQEGLREPFEIYPGVVVPVGIYRHTEGMINVHTNQAAWLSGSSELTIGGFFGGDRVSWEPTVKLRRGDTLSAELGWSVNDVSLPGGDFQTNLARIRLSYSFTPRVFVQCLAQYNDTANVWLTNLRFAWQWAANTGLFIVYNETRDIHQTVLGIPERSLIVKISRLFDVFN